MKRVFVCAVSLFSALAGSASAQPCEHTTYRLEYRTVRYPKEVTTYRVERERHMRPETRVSYKDVWETREQERRYVVQKPVYETAEREESYLACEQQTTMRTEYEERGHWEEQQVCQPGVTVHRPVCVPGSWVADPLTGAMVWNPGGYTTVAETTPSQMVTQRTWKPVVVEVQKPQVTMVQKVVTRKVPYQVLKYVAEERVEKTPIQVCKRVAVEEHVQIPYEVERMVPVKQTQWFERREAYRVPIDPCSGQPIPARSAAPTERAVPAPGPADVRVERPASPPNTPTPAPAEGSVKVDAANENGGMKEPMVPAGEKPEDKGHKEEAGGAAKG